MIPHLYQYIFDCKCQHVRRGYNSIVSLVIVWLHGQQTTTLPFFTIQNMQPPSALVPGTVSFQMQGFVFFMPYFVEKKQSTTTTTLAQTQAWRLPMQPLTVTPPGHPVLDKFPGSVVLKIFLCHCPLMVLCISSLPHSPAIQNYAKLKHIYLNEPRRLIITGSVKRGFQGKDGMKVRTAAANKTNKLTRKFKVNYRTSILTRN